MSELTFPHASITMLDEGGHDRPLSVEFLLDQVVIARYQSGGAAGLSEISFAPQKEAVFIAWANKHKVASAMMRTGWKELYPTIQKVPHYAQLVFVVDAMLHQYFLINHHHTLQQRCKGALIGGDLDMVEIVKWPHLNDLSQLKSMRDGTKSLQRHYNRLVSRLPDDQWIFNQVESLRNLGIEVVPEAHVPKSPVTL